MQHCWMPSLQLALGSGCDHPVFCVTLQGVAELPPHVCLFDDADFGSLRPFGQDVVVKSSKFHRWLLAVGRVFKVLRSHMLHALVPSIAAFEGLVAGFHGARHPSWEPASDAQGVLLHSLDHEVGSGICALVVGCALAGNVGVHAPNVLRVQVLAVEDVAVWHEARTLLHRRLSLIGALAFHADPISQTQVLRADMALPFVLGVEPGGAARIMEDADKRPGVGLARVLVKQRPAGEMLLAFVAEFLVCTVNLALPIAL